MGKTTSKTRRKAEPAIGPDGFALLLRFNGPISALDDRSFWAAGILPSLQSAQGILDRCAQAGFDLRSSGQIVSLDMSRLEGKIYSCADDLSPEGLERAQALAECLGLFIDRESQTPHNCASRTRLFAAALAEAKACKACCAEPRLPSNKSKTPGL